MLQSRLIELSLPKKSFLIKKKINNLKINEQIAQISNSQPLTPFRKINMQVMSSRKTTLDDNIHLISKSKKSIFPTLTNHKKVSPTITPFKPKLKMKFALVNPEYQQKQLYSKKLFNNQFIHPLINRRLFTRQKVRQKSKTLQCQKTKRQLKPIIIQNRLISKFDRIKPSSKRQQFRPIITITKPSTTPTQSNQQLLFTFYPQKQQKNSQNQFLLMQ